MPRDTQKSAQAVATRLTGSRAERLAARYLNRQGLRLLCHNYHCRTGEIDLIARDRTMLVFVEVRMRNNPTRGTAVETVTPAKQRKIIHCARHFLLRNPAFSDWPCRFDVVGISAAVKPGEFQYEWIKNAFQATS